MDSKIYIVISNTWKEGWGCQVSCIYSSSERKDCVRFVERNIQHINPAIRKWEIQDDVDFNLPYSDIIREIKLFEEQQVYLGGHVEE